MELRWEDNHGGTESGRERIGDISDIFLLFFLLRSLCLRGYPLSLIESGLCPISVVLCGKNFVHIASARSEKSKGIQSDEEGSSLV